MCIYLTLVECKGNVTLHPSWWQAKPLLVGSSSWTMQSGISDFWNTSFNNAATSLWSHVRLSFTLQVSKAIGIPLLLGASIGNKCSMYKYLLGGLVAKFGELICIERFWLSINQRKLWMFILELLCLTNPFFLVLNLCLSYLVKFSF